jgi:hypothetical protein
MPVRRGMGWEMGIGRWEIFFNIQNQNGINAFLVSGRRGERMPSLSPPHPYSLCLLITDIKLPFIS